MELVWNVDGAQRNSKKKRYVKQNKNKTKVMSGLIKYFISKSPGILLFNQSNRKYLRPNVLTNVSYKLYSTEKYNKHYDIIIVGGGPAGISMACSICRFEFIILFMIISMRKTIKIRI